MLGFILLDCSAAWLAAQALIPGNEAVWMKVLQARETADAAMKTLQAAVSDDYSRRQTQDEPGYSTHSQYKMFMAGQKVSRRGVVTETPGQRFQFEATFDGTRAQIRNSFQPDRMLTSVDAATLVVPSILPHRIIEYQSPSDLKGQIASGKAILSSVEETTLGAASCVKSVIRTTNGYHITTWYDAQHGFLPRRTEVYHKGILEVLVDSVAFHEVADGEMKFYYPIRGRKKLFSVANGPADVEWRFEVNAESIKVNAEIADGQFALVRRPDEGVYDIDLHAMVIEPGVSDKRLTDPDFLRATVPDNRTDQVRQNPAVKPALEERPSSARGLWWWSMIIVTLVSIGLVIFMVAKVLHRWRARSQRNNEG